VVRSHSIFPILSLGLLLLVIFGCWLFAAQALYVSLLGPAPPQSFTQFITTIFDTPQGWKLIGYGTGIGFVFAVLALSVSVVSFPMLLDRPIDAEEELNVGIEHPVVAPTIDVPIAIQTSIKAVLVNPFTMALWKLIVAGSLAIGFLLVFAGLAWCPFSRIRPGISTARSWNRSAGDNRENRAFRAFEGLTFEIGRGRTRTCNRTTTSRFAFRDAALRDRYDIYRFDSYT
jgi:hypothetical protein